MLMVPRTFVIYFEYLRVGRRKDDRLLPELRGAAPIQWAVLRGHAESGVSIMQMDEGLDTGAMLMTGKLPITDTTTAGALHDDLSALGSKLIVTALDGLAAGTLDATPQPEDGVTYAAKLDKGEGKLDFSQPAEVLARTVRAFDPWPGTWFEVGKDRIKVLAAEAVAGIASDPPTFGVSAICSTSTCVPWLVTYVEANIATVEGAIAMERRETERAGGGGGGDDATDDVDPHRAGHVPVRTSFARILEAWPRALYGGADVPEDAPSSSELRRRVEAMLRGAAGGDDRDGFFADVDAIL